MKLYYCTLCNTNISYQSALYGKGYCKSCSKKEQYRLHPETNPMFGLKGNKSPNFKGGFPKCKDCGIEISRQSIRCRECSYKILDLKGIKNPNYIDGRKNKKYFCLDCGKLLSDYTAQRCQLCANRRTGKKFRGENNPNWIDGRSLERYPSEFNKVLKYKIFKRDNYTCQKCHIYPCNDLSAHHIDYDKQNCKEENLITLCFPCNLKVNCNRDYWYSYFSYIMENVIYG